MIKLIFIYKSARSLLVSILFYAQIHGYINIKTNIIVSDCTRGTVVYKSHFYKYKPNGAGIEFIDDKDFKIVDINIIDDGSLSFYLEAPELKD